MRTTEGRHPSSIGLLLRLLNERSEAAPSRRVDASLSEPCVDRLSVAVDRIRVIDPISNPARRAAARVIGLRPTIESPH